MTEVPIPYELVTILGGISTATAILLAYPSLRDSWEKHDNKSLGLKLLGLGVIYLTFIIPTLFKFFHAYGTLTFLITFLWVTVPISLWALFPKPKYLRIAMGVFCVLLLILAIIMALSGVQ